MCVVLALHERTMFIFDTQGSLSLTSFSVLRFMIVFVFVNFYERIFVDIVVNLIEFVNDVPKLIEEYQDDFL